MDLERYLRQVKALGCALNGAIGALSDATQMLSAAKSHHGALRAQLQEYEQQQRELKKSTSDDKTSI